MKFISWNVNGIRSVLQKDKSGNKIEKAQENGIDYIVKTYDPDVICLQEVKCSPGHQTELKQYETRYPNIYVNCSKARKGYSGVLIMSKERPKEVYYEFEKMSLKDINHDFLQEGRLITLDFDKFYLVNCYTPNSKQKLERLEQRTKEWEPLFRSYIKTLQKDKPVIVCGDLNVAYTELDLHNTKGHSRSAGFTKEEREEFGKLLEECELTDTFREKYPTERKYTYFSNFRNSRQNNKGWRIDYFLVSSFYKKKFKRADIMTDIYGSDHVPIYLEI
jgi:exodeoxyribonuclease III